MRLLKPGESALINVTEAFVLLEPIEQRARRLSRGIRLSKRQCPQARKLRDVFAG